MGGAHKGFPERLIYHTELELNWTEQAFPTASSSNPIPRGEHKDHTKNAKKRQKRHQQNRVRSTAYKETPLRRKGKEINLNPHSLPTQNQTNCNRFFNKALPALNPSFVPSPGLTKGAKWARRSSSKRHPEQCSARAQQTIRLGRDTLPFTG